MSVMEDGVVLTEARLSAEIARQIAAADIGGGGTPGPAATPETPRRFLATQRPVGYYSWWTEDTSDAQTFGELRTLVGASGWVRLGFSYDRTNGPCSIAAAKMAQTSVEAIPPNPVDQFGNAVAWSDVTFNNGGADVSLADQLMAAIDSSASPVTTLVLPAPPENATPWAETPNHRKQPGFVWSDWIYVPPQRRTDGGAYNLLWTLVKFTGTVAVYRATGPTYGTTGRFIRSYIETGDAVTDPTDFASTTLSVKSAGLTVQYVPQSPVVQVFHTGDSTEAAVLNHVSLAVLALSTAAIPIEYCSTATGGLSAQEYAEKLRPVLAGSQASIVFLRVWSPNAGTSWTASQRGWAEVMQLALDVKAAGGVPVLMTPYPNPGRITTANQEAIRLEMVRRCRDAAVAGVRVLDLDELMSDNASPVAGILPGYSDDGTHPTQDGLELMSELATRPLLADLIANLYL